MSYKQISTVKVTEACKKFLDERQAKIFRLQEPTIQKTMKGGWFRKPMSREEAIKHLELDSDLWSDYEMVKYTNFFDSDRVLNLLSLCQIPGEDIINVEARDASILEKYF